MPPSGVTCRTPARQYDVQVGADFSISTKIQPLGLHCNKAGCPGYTRHIELSHRAQPVGDEAVAEEYGECGRAEDDPNEARNDKTVIWLVINLTQCLAKAARK